MDGFNQERRGLFDGVKVPFDVKAILLAAVGIVTFWVGIQVIEAFWPHDIVAKRGLCTVIAGNVTIRLGYVGHVVASLLQFPNEGVNLPLGTWVCFFGWSACVWSFFSAAICRIAAMKIAREETLELKDAVNFGVSKFFPNLLSIGFVFAIIAFFYFVCDATLAGWVGRIPYLGDILMPVIFLLVLLSSFFIVFTAALGLLGFNLSAAAIATEASDTFDGVSRSWNYILARPWHVLLTYGLTFAYIGVFLFFGSYFLKVSVKSLGVRWWGMSHEARVYKPAGRDLAQQLGIKETDEARLPGKAEYLYKRIIQKDANWTGDVILYPQLVNGAETQVNVYPALESTLRVTGGAIWFWVALAELLMYAYAVSYFLSSQTAVYFLLRKEVEGDDYTEINLEEEEEDDEEMADFGTQTATPPPTPLGKPLPTAGAAAPAPAAAPAGGAKLPLAGGHTHGAGEKKHDDHHGHAHGPGEKH